MYKQPENKPYHPFSGFAIRSTHEILKDLAEGDNAKIATQMLSAYENENSRIGKSEEALRASEGRCFSELIIELIMSLDEKNENSHLGISHITGVPISSLNILHKQLFNCEGFDYLVEQISHIFNSHLKDNSEDFEMASKFKVLFIELLQNIEQRDLDITSKATGKPVRTINEIYDELRNQATLSEHLSLLNRIVRKAIYKESQNEEISNYIAFEFYEIWTEIFINIHNGVIFVEESKNNDAKTKESTRNDSSKGFGVYVFSNIEKSLGDKADSMTAFSREQIQRRIMFLRDRYGAVCIRILSPEGHKQAQQFELDNNRFINYSDIKSEWIAEDQFDWFTLYDLDGSTVEDNCVDEIKPEQLDNDNGS